MRLGLTFVLVAGVIGFLRDQRSSEPPTYGYEVVRSYPHDPQAFTQGLVYRNAYLYEGTGLNGRSSIRRVRLDTGLVLDIRPLQELYFGEGITELNGSIYQLTWRNGLAFVYDANTLDHTRTFTYTGEGWGLTTDGTRLIMSDGSAQLRFLDPVTFRELRRITVRDPNGAVEQLNELEWVKGEIFANVWQTDRIVRIAPNDGRVTGWIDLSGLLTPEQRMRTDVLNGIAYDQDGDRLFVTGKLWPRVFEIKLVRK